MEASTPPLTPTKGGLPADDPQGNGDAGDGNGEATPAPNEGKEKLGSHVKQVWKSYSLEFRDAALYCAFLLIFWTVAFTSRSADAYWMKRGLEAKLFQSEYAPHTTYYDMTTHGEIFPWLEEVVMPVLRPEEAVLDTNSTTTSRFLGGGSSNTLIMGLPRMRLVRARNSSCQVFEAFDAVQSCYAGVEVTGFEATDDFNGLEWQSSDATGSSSFESTSTKLDYPGSGYVVDLPANATEASELLASLRDSAFIDRSSRALLLDFNAYNVNLRIFSVVTALIEILPTGVLIASSKFRTAPLLLHRMAFRNEETAANMAVVFLEMILYGFVCLFLLKDLRRMRKKGVLIYLGSNIFRWVDLLNYSSFMGVMGMRIYAIYSMDQVFDRLPWGSETEADMEHLNLVPAAEAVVLVDRLMAFSAILSTLRLFAVLRTNKELSQYIDTIMAATLKLTYQMVVVGAILAAYAMGFELSFGNSVEDYRDFPSSALTLFKALVGEFDLTLVRDTNRFIGPLLFTSYILIMMFVVISMFLSIVNSTFDQVQLRIRTKIKEADPIQRDFVRATRGLREWIKARSAWIKERAGKKALVIPVEGPTEVEPLKQKGEAGLKGMVRLLSGNREVLLVKPRTRVNWAKGLSEVSSKTVMQRMLRLQRQQAQLEDMIAKIGGCVSGLPRKLQPATSPVAAPDDTDSDG
ncbi:unnamed protein product [Chrysoparadoxa australica]